MWAALASWNWGSVADWVAGIGTVGALYYAVHSFNRSGLAADRAQADLIAFDHEVVKLKNFDTLERFNFEGVIRVTNRSSQPITLRAFNVDDYPAGRIRLAWAALRARTRWPIKLSRTIWIEQAKRYTSSTTRTDFSVTTAGVERYQREDLVLAPGEEAESSFYTSKKNHEVVEIRFTDARNQSWNMRFGDRHPQRLKMRQTPRLVTRKEITMDDLFGRSESQ
ncbi:hypothetical protein C5C57_05555 [Rathayibacter sp. AY1C5]|nr:hypothetical protein C5C57_05555 [Rathayibacter sp. AY1C5]